MIDATPSLEAAKGLTGIGLVNYLVSHGWTAQPSRIDGISIVSKEISGADRPAEFILPVKPGWEDEHRRIADALRTIEAIEGRPLKQIANDVRSSSVTPNHLPGDQTTTLLADASGAPAMNPGTLTKDDIVVMMSMIDYLITEISRVDVISADVLTSARKSLERALPRAREGVSSSESESKASKWWEFRRSLN
jgi:hypothetical protein